MATTNQKARQNYRNHDGQYSKVNPCYYCGKSAGVDYCSDRRTDDVFNDEGLCLCYKCCSYLDKLSDEEALRRLTLSNRGKNPQKCD